MTMVVRVVDPPVRCRCAQPADGASRPPGRWAAASRRVRPIAGVDRTAASGTGTADRCATAGALHYGIRERHPVREPHPAREGLRRTLALRRGPSPQPQRNRGIAGGHHPSAVQRERCAASPRSSDLRPSPACREPPAAEPAHDRRRDRIARAGNREVPRPFLLPSGLSPSAPASHRNRPRPSPCPRAQRRRRRSRPSTRGSALRYAVRGLVRSHQDWRAAITAGRDFHPAPKEGHGFWR